MQADGTLAAVLAKSGARPRREVNFPARGDEADLLTQDSHDYYASNDDTTCPEASLLETELLEHTYCFACDLDNNIDLSNHINDIDPVTMRTTEDASHDLNNSDYAHIVQPTHIIGNQPSSVGLQGGARGDDNRASLIGL